ncbi:hypothetical protein FB451DRAFT_991265, partial [Mycena latifolia]
LGTNYWPQDKELTEIGTLLTESTQAVKHLDDQITRLQKLVDERAKLSDYMDAHRALLSPARRLPVDIIERIFMDCLPTHRNCVMSAAEAPVLLGRICSSRRTICLSTPYLWSRVHIVEPSICLSARYLYVEKLMERLETTRMWLERSGQCPLSISLQASYLNTSSYLGTDDELIKALLPFTLRWEHITFTVPPSCLVAIAHLTTVDVPMLKSVSI